MVVVGGLKGGDWSAGCCGLRETVAEGGWGSEGDLRWTKAALLV
jgi:hypothetical protein